MVTYLDHNLFWRGAKHFYHADTLPFLASKRKNLPHNAAQVDTASIQALANRIRTYFHHTEGRGNNCVVEPFVGVTATTSLPTLKTIPSKASSG